MLHQKVKFSKSHFHPSVNASVDLKAKQERSEQEQKVETSVDLKAKLERPSFLAKKLVEEGCLTKFLVTSDHEIEIKKLTRKVLETIVKTLADNFEIHGYGKKSVKGAEKVVQNLYRWVDVTNIKTGFMEGEGFIVVYFRSQRDTHLAYRKQKRRAENARTTRQIIQNQNKPGLEESLDLESVEVYSPKRF